MGDKIKFNTGTVVDADGYLYQVGSKIEATAAELNASVSGATATSTEVNQLDSSTNIDKMSRGVGAVGVGGDYKVSTIRVGNVITTTMYIDLTGLASINTDLDAIGLAAGGAAPIGQVTTAVNGLLFDCKLGVAEVPAGGTLDINIASATAGTYAYNTAMAGQAGYVLNYNANGALAVTADRDFATCPVADSYIYLLSGEAANNGTYTAGKLILTLKGLVV